VETDPSTDAPGVIRNSIGMGLKLLSGGTFTMGEALIDEDRQFERHVVTLTRPFFIGTHEVTNAQWKRVMGNVPSYAKGSGHPVEQVSWEDAVAFCNALSDLPEERQAGRVYRLPTEAEWEYACRAGTTTRFSFGDEDTPDSRMGEYSWYLSNSGSDQQGGPDKHAPNVTHPVGTKRPNPWGLYDMDGNVREWCSDWFRELDIGPATDPQGPAAGTDRATRGGYFSAQIWDARPARRYGSPPTTKSPWLGFRVAVTALPGSATEAADRRAE
jgi:formylglycine-generating enzyme required for sulfatase activity